MDSDNRLEPGPAEVDNECESEKLPLMGGGLKRLEVFKRLELSNELEFNPDRLADDEPPMMDPDLTPGPVAPRE